MDITNYFPVPVHSSFLRDATEEEMNKIIDLKKTPNAENQTSHNNYVLELPEFHSLKIELQQKMSEFFYTLFPTPKERPLEILITQSWFNYTSKAEAHHLHNHPNSFLSGTWYPKAYEEDMIQFSSPIMRNYPFKIIPTEWNHWNSWSWNCPVKQGQILFFPSWLDHNVPPVSHENERISLAFNTRLKGWVGEQPELTELYLQ